MGNLLKIKNDYSWLISDDYKVRYMLWESLRFRQRNYFHNASYKQKKWDGYTEFFKMEAGRFMTGLLPEVRAALNKLQVSYETKDERTRLSFKHTDINNQFLNQWLPYLWLNGEPARPITLHDYQVDFINQIAKHQRGVVISPTGSGKTMVLIGVLKSLPPVPTLVLQNKTDLSRQNYEEISNWGFQNVGTLWGNKVKPNLITVANIQSVHKILPILPKIQVLIVDEIHEMISKIPKAVYRKCKNASVRIAMSATPFKWSGLDQVQKYDVKGFFGPLFLTNGEILTTKELQERQILSKANCVFFCINEPKIPYELYQDAVTKGIVENEFLNKNVTKLVKKLKGRTLVLVDRIDHGNTLKELNDNAIWIHGEHSSDVRKEAIDKLQRSSSKQTVIATQQIMNTGINVKIHNLVNLAGGKADHMIVQRMGRGLRKADDKDILNYYDFIFRNNDYLFNHSNTRVKILKKEGHPITIKEDFS